MKDRTELEPYEPHKDAWQPRGRPSKRRRDTEETLLEIEDRKPRKRPQVKLENLPEPQRTQEIEFWNGYRTYMERKKGRETRRKLSEGKERSVRDDAGIAAFELGWDTAQRKAQAAG